MQHLWSAIKWRAIQQGIPVVGNRYAKWFGSVIKILNKLGIKENLQNLIKGIYENAQLTSYFMLSLLLWSEMRQRCPLLPLLTNIVLEIQASANKVNKEIKGTWIGKKE